MGWLDLDFFFLLALIVGCWFRWWIMGYWFLCWIVHSRLWVVLFGGGLLSLTVDLLGLGGLRLRLLSCGRWGCNGGFVGCWW